MSGECYFMFEDWYKVRELTRLGTDKEGTRVVEYRYDPKNIDCEVQVKVEFLKHESGRRVLCEKGLGFCLLRKTDSSGRTYPGGVSSEDPNEVYFIRGENQ